MAFVIADRVKETTTTTGTGTVSLAGASTGYQSFSAGIGNANSTYYCIAGGSEWEVGIGTYTTSGSTLSRTTVLASSNANALVTFSAGTKDVFVTAAAGKILTEDGVHADTAKTTPADLDEMPLLDSAASYAAKRLSWASLKAAVKSFVGASGGGVDLAFIETDRTITTSYTIGSAGYVSGVTVTVASPGVFTLTGHNFTQETLVMLSTTGALPTGLAVDTPYYVIAAGLTSSTFELSTTLNGAAINTTGTQSGTHSVGRVRNAISAGPTTVATGATITVPTGSTWTIP